MISTVTTMTCDVCGASAPYDANAQRQPQGFVLLDMRPCKGGHVHTGHACSETCASKLAASLYSGRAASCVDCMRAERVKKAG